MSWVKKGVRLMKWLRDTNAIVRIVALLLCVSVLSTVYVGEARTVSTEPMRSQQTVSSGDAVIEEQTESTSDDETEAAEGGGGTSVSAGESQDAQQTVSSGDEVIDSQTQVPSDNETDAAEDGGETSVSSGDVQQTYGIAPRVITIPGGSNETPWKLYAKATGPVGVTLTHEGTSIELGTSSYDLGYVMETSMVTIGVAVESGYEVASITAGTAEVTDNGDGTYTFKMPIRETELVIETQEIVPATFTITQKGSPCKVLVSSNSKVFAASEDSTEYTTTTTSSSSSAVFYLVDKDIYIKAVTLSSVPTAGEIKSVSIYVDGVKNESALVKNSTTSYSFASDFYLPRGSSAELVVEFDSWKSLTVNQTDNTGGSVLGTVSVKAAVGETSGNVFWANSSTTNTLKVTSVSTTWKIKPGGEIVTVTVTPMATRYIKSVNVYAIDALGSKTKLPMEEPADFASTGTNVYTLDYTIPAGTEIIVDVEYGAWQNIVLSQSDATGGNVLGTVTVEADKGDAVENVFRANSSSNSVSTAGEKFTAQMQPGGKLLMVKVTPKPTRYVRDVKVYAVDAQGKKTEVKIKAPDTFVPAGTNVYTLDYTIPDGTGIIVEVVYGGWQNITVNQTDNPGNSILGTVVVQGAAGETSENVFRSASGSTNKITTSLAETVYELKPGGEIVTVTVTPMATRYIKSVNVYAIDALGSKTKLPMEEPADFASTGTNVYTLDYTIPAGTEIIVDVEYGAWQNIVLSQSDATGGNVLGTVTVEADKGDAVENVFRANSSSNSVSTAGEKFTAQMQPGGKLLTVKVNPERTRYVKDVKVYAVDAQGKKTEVEIKAPDNFAPAGINVYTLDYTIPDGTGIIVEVVYGGWKNITVNQTDATGGNVLGTVTVEAVVGETSDHVFVTNALNNTLSGSSESFDAIVKPGGKLVKVKVEPERTRYIEDVNVYAVDEQGNKTEIDIEWPEVFLPTDLNVFTLDYVIPVDKDIIVDVVYGGWHTLTVNQTDTTGKDMFGTVTVQADVGDTSDHVFVTNALSNKLEVSSESFDALVKPGGKLVTVTVKPYRTRSVTDVDIYAVDKDGNRTDIAFATPESFVPTESNEYTLNYTVLADTDIVIDVKYGEWKDITINQTDISGENMLGTVTVKGGYGLGRLHYPFWSGTSMATTSMGSSTATLTYQVKPYSELVTVTVKPYRTRSIVDLDIYALDADGNRTDIPFEIPDNFTPTDTNIFTIGYDVPENTDIVVDVTYGEWKDITINQTDISGENMLGTVTVKGDKGASRIYYPFWSGTSMATKSMGSSIDTLTYQVKPYSELVTVTVKPYRTRSIVDVDIYALDADGNRTDIPFETPDTFNPTETTVFTLGYDVPADTDIVVDVTYGEWKDITINQTDISGENMLGTVTVKGDKGASKILYPFWSGTSMATKSISCSTATISYQVKPYSELVTVTVKPYRTRSIVDVDIYALDADGNRTDIPFETPDTFNPTETTVFTLGYDVPENTDIVVDVKYGEWQDITINQTDTLGAGKLGTVRVKGDKGASRILYPFWSGTSMATTSMGCSTETLSYQLKPYSEIVSFSVSPDSTRTILDIDIYAVDADGNKTDIPIKLPQEYDPAETNVFLLNYDVPENCDIVIDVKYGAALYAKANVEDVVTLDLVALTDEFASVGEIDSAQETVAIEVADGWRIVSVKYGTRYSQNTAIVGENGNYTFAPTGDTYIVVEVQQIKNNITARLEGNGEVDITGDDTRFTLYTTPLTFGNSVPAGKQINFTLTAHNGTKILGVTVNGEELTADASGKYSFIMPEKVAEIVVEAEQIKNDVYVRFEGSGYASFECGDISAEIKTEARVMKHSVLEGEEVTFTVKGLSGTKILSVTADGIDITDNKDGTYSMTMGRSEVCVVVKAERITGNITARLDGNGVVDIAGDDTKFTLFTESKPFAFSVLAGTQVSFTLTAYSGTRILGVTVNGEELTADANGKYTFAMPETDAEIVVKAERITNNIYARLEGNGEVDIIGDDNNFTLYTTSKMFGNSVLAGTQINFTLKSYNGTKILGVTVNGEELTADANGKYSFTMPETDAEIVVKAEQIKKNIYARLEGNGEVDIIGDSNKFTLLTTPKTFGNSVLAGTQINFTLKTYNSTKILGVTVNGEELTADASGKYTFTMPETDVEIVVKAQQIKKNIYARLEGSGEVDIKGDLNSFTLSTTSRMFGNSVLAGKQIDFTLKTYNGTRILGVTVNGEELTADASGTYSFTMPETDAEIVVKAAYNPVKAKLVGSGEVTVEYNGEEFELGSDVITIDPDVKKGIIVEFTPVAAKGTIIKNVTAQGAYLLSGSDGSYNFAMLEEEVIIIVEAEYAAYDILALKTGDGDAAVSYDGTLTELTETAQTVAEGVDSGDYELVIKPAQNSTIMSVSVDGTPVTPDSAEDDTYTVTVDDKDVTVTVDVRKNPTITVNRTGSGVVYTNSGTTDVSNTTYSVARGSDHSFDFIPHEGESLISVTVKRGDGNAVTVYDAAGSSGGAGQRAQNVALGSSEFSYDLTDVDEDCVITARFTEPEQYKLYVIKQGTGAGSITCGSDKYTESFTLTLDEGSEPKLAIAAADGSKLVFVKMGESKESAAEVTLTDGALDVPAMNGDVYVIVEFEKTAPSGGDPADGPKTGDSAEGVSIAINLMLVSALAAYVCFMQIRKKRRDEAQ